MPGAGLGFTPIVVYGPAITITDMPAAVTEFFTSRLRANLEGFTQIRFGVNVYVVSSSGTSLMQVQYTLDLTGAAGWTDLVGSNLALNVAGHLVTSWNAIPAAARNVELLIRTITQNGNGTDDPIVGGLMIHLR